LKVNVPHNFSRKTKEGEKGNFTKYHIPAYAMQTRYTTIVTL